MRPRKLCLPASPSIHSEEPVLPPKDVLQRRSETGAFKCMRGLAKNPFRGLSLLLPRFLIGRDASTYVPRLDRFSLNGPNSYGL